MTEGINIPRGKPTNTFDSSGDEIYIDDTVKSGDGKIEGKVISIANDNIHVQTSFNNIETIKSNKVKIMETTKKLNNREILESIVTKNELAILNKLIDSDKRVGVLERERDKRVIADLKSNSGKYFVGESHIKRFMKLFKSLNENKFVNNADELMSALYSVPQKDVTPDMITPEMIDAFNQDYDEFKALYPDFDYNDPNTWGLYAGAAYDEFISLKNDIIAMMTSHPEFIEEPENNGEVNESYTTINGQPIQIFGTDKDGLFVVRNKVDGLVSFHDRLSLYENYIIASDDIKFSKSPIEIQASKLFEGKTISFIQHVHGYDKQGNETLDPKLQTVDANNYGILFESENIIYYRDKKTGIIESCGVSGGKFEALMKMFKEAKDQIAAALKNGKRKTNESEDISHLTDPSKKYKIEFEGKPEEVKFIKKDGDIYTYGYTKKQAGTDDKGVTFELNKDQVIKNVTVNESQETDPNKWLAQATEILKKKVHLEPSDVDLDLEVAKKAIADNESAEDWIDWIISKHGLVVDEDGAAGSEPDLAISGQGADTFQMRDASATQKFESYRKTKKVNESKRDDQGGFSNAVWNDKAQKEYEGGKGWVYSEDRTPEFDKFIEAEAKKAGLTDQEIACFIISGYGRHAADDAGNGGINAMKKSLPQAFRDFKKGFDYEDYLSETVGEALTVGKSVKASDDLIDIEGKLVALNAKSALIEVEKDPMGGTPQPKDETAFKTRWAKTFADTDYDTNFKFDPSKFYFEFHSTDVKEGKAMNESEDADYEWLKKYMIVGNFGSDQKFFDKADAFIKNDTYDINKRSEIIDKYDKAMGMPPDKLDAKTKIEKFIKDVSEEGNPRNQNIDEAVDLEKIKTAVGTLDQKSIEVAHKHLYNKEEAYTDEMRDQIVDFFVKNPDAEREQNALFGNRMDEDKELTVTAPELSKYFSSADAVEILDSPDKMILRYAADGKTIYMVSKLDSNKFELLKMTR